MKHVISSIALAILISGCQARPVRVDQVNQQIDQAIPSGSSQAQVLVWLQERQAEYSIREDHKEITALLRGTRPGFVTGSIQLIFDFDQNWKLISHHSKELFTGP